MFQPRYGVQAASEFEMKSKLPSNLLFLFFPQNDHKRGTLYHIHFKKTASGFEDPAAWFHGRVGWAKVLPTRSKKQRNFKVKNLDYPGIENRYPKSVTKA